MSDEKVDAAIVEIQSIMSTDTLKLNEALDKRDWLAVSRISVEMIKNLELMASISLIRLVSGVDKIED